MEAQQSFKTFLVVWIGQLVSVVGSGLTSFGLAVWVLERTGSTTQYAMIGLAAILPMVLLSPIAGVFVDRWDRRTTMIYSDLVAGMSTVFVAVLLYVDRLELWHILVMAVVASSAGVFQRPAYMAAVTQVVPQEHLGRAAGLMQLAEPLSTILAPVIAGALIGLIGLSGIIVIDFASFLVAMATLAFVRFPQHDRAESQHAPNVIREAKEGWQYVRDRHGMVHLMFFFLAVNFVFGFVGVLYAPLVLSFSGPGGLGTVMAVAGLGGIVGGIGMGVWGGPRRRAPAIYALCAGLGLTVALTGLRANIVLVAAAAFLTMVILAVVSAVGQVLWQLKTDPAYQGRVFAMRNMFAMLAMPIAYVVAGPLADRVFEPAMRDPSSAMASVFGAIVGVGEGRGLGLMCVFAGLAAVAVSLAAFAVPILRDLDTRLPDHAPSEAIEPAAAAT